MSALALLLALQTLASAPVVRGTVTDALTGAVVAGAEVRAPGRSTVTDQRGRFAITTRVGDTLHVRRIGYRTASVTADSPELALRLEPVALRLAILETRDSASRGGPRAHVSVRTVESGAALSTAEAISRLPFVTPRSSRGAVAVSMRGSRPEQVAVLLDGVPLNDPATGVADISDIPLAALGGLSAAPGAALAAAGLGAGGGVLSLSSGAGSTARVVAGAYGRAGLSGAHPRAVGRGVVRAGGEWTAARNDFAFVNTVATPDSVERRANSDGRRLSLFTTFAGPGARALVLLSDAERGLVGPMNVRAYDEARGRTRRALVGGAATHSGWTASAALRALDLRYRNPPAGTIRALSLSADAQLAGRLRGLWARGGVGADRVIATGLRDELRPRAFAAAEGHTSVGRWHGALALRADAVRDAGAHVSPSASLERRGAVTVYARGARAFRAPTFYDLYMVTPQWVSPARALAPERVVLDAEVGARAALGRVGLHAALFERRTRDAIVWFPGTFLWSPKNVPDERARGAELRVSATAARAEVDAWASVRSTLLSVDGLRVASPYVPVADGGATARARVGALELSSALSVIGRRPFALVPRRSPTTDLPPVLLADVALRWRVPMGRASAELTGGLHNAGGARWQPVDRYPAPGRSWVLGLTINP